MELAIKLPAEIKNELSSCSIPNTCFAVDADDWFCKFNTEILSYSISNSPNFAQTKTMMNELFKVLPKDATPLLHSDQGWQYQMKEYQQMLKEHNITQSMSRKGNCLDNSVMENFFGRLKIEMFFGEQFRSVKDFEEKLKEYICYFNTERISLKRKGMSPVQYRTHSMYQ